MPHTFKHKFTAIGVGGDQLPQNFPIGFVEISDHIVTLVVAWVVRSP